uniref:Uncharacterized protein n=1 Tax=Cynoglossus semilaevis TaxID=244447 RepID=A0A3P8WM80_CYNSE
DEGGGVGGGDNGDLCSVINCNNWKYTYNLYVCFHYYVHSQCEQNQLPHGGGWRENWNMVVGYTGQWIPTINWKLYDPMGFIRVVIRNEITKHDTTLLTPVIAVDYTKLTPKDIMTTGYTTENLWLKWFMNTAKENGVDDCVAARPQLFTEPAPLFPNDTWGYNCMLRLTHEATDPNCTTLASIFPPISNKTKTGAFTPHKGKGDYVCFNFTHSNPKVNIGKIDPSWCNVTMSGSMIGRWGRDGTDCIITAVGIRALVRLGVPLAIIGPNKLNKTPTYIDAIGVPRGIPNEYKLDAMEGLSEQLAPTSLMSVQNRMALDMMLAEKGGVCAMFGEMCCTFIPNNTAPDGTVKKALQGLKTLSRRMHEDSGVGHFLEEWFEQTFVSFVAILISCGCCCIPCMRSLSIRLIETALDKRTADAYFQQQAEEYVASLTKSMSVCKDV